MNESFEFHLGGLNINYSFDDRGISANLGFKQVAIPWERVIGACLLRRDEKQLSDRTTEAKLEKFSPALAQAIEEGMHVAQTMDPLMIGYRDERGRKQEIKLLIDPSGPRREHVLSAFKSRLGKNWLGEGLDEKQATRRMHLEPSMVMGALIAMLLLAVLLAVVLAVALGQAALLALFSPKLLISEIREGNYGLLFAHALTIVIFILGYQWIRAWWRSRFGNWNKLRPIRQLSRSDPSKPGGQV
ncbi:MAG TPA: hypothetical protein VEG30_14270 [Terriglobales bacterium]|nr:hypothetical protein [Terriglobales bacterium]